MRGSCKCNNIEVHWHTVDYTIVPRKCQCEYCLAKDAVYVSKSASRIDVHIHNETVHKRVQHGSNSADFHECAFCGDLVFVTAAIDGELFGALNANCLENKTGFPDSVQTDFSHQTAGDKLQRWRQNWCYPVHIKYV